MHKQIMSQIKMKKRNDFADEKYTPLNERHRSAIRSKADPKIQTGTVPSKAEGTISSLSRLTASFPSMPLGSM
jgi:desulfoferrodoxin (superoxide reductase-like protein)